MNTLSLKLEKQLPCTPEAAFDAWTTPASMGAWISPMGEAKIPVHDLTVGGDYQIDMLGEDAVYKHTGKFTAIDRPNKLAFTWVSDGTAQKETLVTLTFVHNEGGTLLTLAHEDFTAAEMVEQHTGGWTVILDKMAGTVTT